jgi:hypothetical protein
LNPAGRLNLSLPIIQFGHSFAEKMKALDVTPKTKLVQELVEDHVAMLHDINFTVKRTQDFRWFATALFTVYRTQREHAPLSSAGPKTVERWLHEDGGEPEAYWGVFATQFKSAVDLLINIVTSNGRRALYVQKPPMTVAPRASLHVLLSVACIQHFHS